MALKISDRYKNVEEFLDDLVAEPQVEDEVTQFRTNATGKMQYRIKELNRSKKRSVFVGILLVSMVLVIVWFVTDRSWKKPTTDTISQEQGNSSQEDNTLCLMPNVIGLQETEARQQIRKTDSKIQITIQEKNSTEKEGSTTQDSSSGTNSEKKAAKKQNSGTTQSSKNDVKVIEENDYDEFQID